MPKRPDLTDLTTQYGMQSTLNNNWDEIQEAFDNTLSRDGSSPNQMEASLDMNSNSIVNASAVYASDFIIGSTSLINAFAQAAQNAEDAEEAAESAEESAALASLYASTATGYYSTRDELVTDVQAGLRHPEGFEVTAGGFAYKSEPGANVIPDLPDYVPVKTFNGRVHVKQFGAVGDGDRYTGRGTDDTDAIRAAFDTQDHITFGRGTYRVTGPILNVVENRRVEGAGKGVLLSSPDTIKHFNPSSCLLATGKTFSVLIENEEFGSDLGARWNVENNDPSASSVEKNSGSSNPAIRDMPANTALKFEDTTDIFIQTINRYDVDPTKGDVLFSGSVFFTEETGGLINVRVQWFDSNGDVIYLDGSSPAARVGVEDGGYWRRFVRRFTPPANASEVIITPDYLADEGDPIYLTNVHVEQVENPIKRIITRRKYRNFASDPNDDPYAAVIENWGGGSTYSNFSIELLCDYTDEDPDNYGDEWDIGFFNGCRGSVGCEKISINGYFRRATYYWDVTDAFGIPNHLDLDGNPLPLNGPDDFGYPPPAQGGATVRSSGSDHCWMYACEAKGGRVGRAILGADRNRTGGVYYDYVTDDFYGDFRGGSGVSDFRSRDCTIFGPNHHSGWRLANPVNYGSDLTEAGMDSEPDDAPAAQHVDVWASNVTLYGPADSGRGLVFDDLRYVSWEMFITRWGACQEVYLGPRVWCETGDGLYDVKDADGNDIANTYDDSREAYAPLATDDLTGWLKWENISIQNIEQKWVRDWRYTTITDRKGRIRGPRNRREQVNEQTSYTYLPVENAGILRVVVRLTNNVPVSSASGILLYDSGSTPTLQLLSDSSVSSAFQFISAGDDPATEADPDKLVMKAEEDQLVFYNNLSGGDIILYLDDTTG